MSSWQSPNRGGGNIDGGIEQGLFNVDKVMCVGLNRETVCSDPALYFQWGGR